MKTIIKIVRIQYFEATFDKFNTVGLCIGGNFITILNFQFYNKLV
jgi:hypothetical protein